MEVIGAIKLITETQYVGQNGFKKRDIIITTDEQYPQTLSIQFVQDRCDILDNFQIGQVVIIAINLRGNEWVNPQGETKYFNTIQGWKIELKPLSNTQPQSAVDQYHNQAPVTPQQAVETTQQEEDDLPF